MSGAVRHLERDWIVLGSYSIVTQLQESVSDVHHRFREAAEKQSAVLSQEMWFAMEAISESILEAGR